jgi:(R,R)-butanediol dehydrogenase/meso-butanediol dehydrogenase/diacetyl reductase
MIPSDTPKEATMSTSDAPAAIPSTMRGAVLHARHDLRIEDVAVPGPGPGELLLRTEIVGVCGTDAAEWANGPRLFPLETRHPVSGHLGPMVIGHEFSGTVIEVGEGVDGAWIGRLVASCGAEPCGTCTACTTGRSNLCRRYSSVGVYRNGALAEYVSTPVASCVDAEALGLSAEEAALVQPMAIAVHAMRRARVGAGDVAVVQGVGGIGAFLVHALADLGAKVIAVDLAQDRLDIARALGAQASIVGGTAETADLIAAEFGDAIPVFYEVTGSAPGLQLALDLAPAGTQIVQVGIHKAPREVDLARLTLRELTLLGTNALVRETDFPEAARLIAGRRGDWGLIAPAPIPMEDVVEGALRPMAEGRPPAIKSLIHI